MTTAPRVLITGASAGIGAALARAYARQGARVVLVARRADRLEALAAETGGIACVADVTRAGDMERAAVLARDRLGGLDIVIANAGYGVSGRIESLSPDDVQRQFATNVFGVVATCQACLPLLRASRGRLAIVGSVAGTLPIPGSSAYCMSKAALRPLAECLALELVGSGVSVTLITPGFVASELRSVGTGGVFHGDQPDPVPAFLVMPAERAAAQMLRAIRRRRREVVITWHARFLLLLWSWVPGLMRFSGRRLLPWLEGSARRPADPAGASRP